jgi:catechol 2,3-dioxygenase-like lactoylglutathione lyase family enzyme
MITLANEVARPFLPTKDFDQSRAFYEALGFKKLLDGEVAIFAVGATSFILQRHYEKAWAENTMMQLMVDDLDQWWAHLAELDLANSFNVQPPKPPAMQPWGLRVAYVYDPCGVLWHVSQRRPAHPAD